MNRRQMLTACFVVGAGFDSVAEYPPVVVIDERIWVENRTRTNPITVLDPVTLIPRKMYGRIRFRQRLLAAGWSPKVIMNPDYLKSV